MQDTIGNEPLPAEDMPGVYDIGPNTLTMQQYVDIEGSGETVTKVTGTNDVPALFVGASNIELRFLTIEAKGAYGFNTARGMLNTSSSPKLTHVTILATGEVNTIGIENHGSSPILTDVTITLRPSAGGGYGMTIDGNDGASTLKVKNSAITFLSGASWCVGIHNSGHLEMANAVVDVTGCTGTPDGVVWGAFGYETTASTIRESVIKGTRSSIYGSDWNLSIAYSQVVGPIVNPYLTKCLGLYNENLEPVTCP